MAVSSRLVALAAHVWEGDVWSARLARFALAPVAALYGAVVAYRNRRYALGLTDGTPAPTGLAALSVGNLTVGGTGKTPMASWCAEQLLAAGARPAIVLRGYGDDEWRVHELLTPTTPVVVNPDRTAGMRTAASSGADVVVLDDAFQHRRAPRAADLVLLSVDRWRGAPRLLPAGPFREPLTALRRASVVVLTMKGATDAAADVVEAAVRAVAPTVPVVRVRLDFRDVRQVSAADLTLPSGAVWHPLSWLRGRQLVAVSGIADPAAFEGQLVAAGAALQATHRFPDHHDFTPDDVALLVDAASLGEGVICTLKDAVKLAPRWPRAAPPLWYVSQTIVVDRGAEALDRVIARVLAARVAATPTAD